MGESESKSKAFSSDEVEPGTGDRTLPQGRIHAHPNIEETSSREVLSLQQTGDDNAKHST